MSAGLALGTAAMVIAAVTPAEAASTTATPTAHCAVGKLGFVVPVDDPQDPIAEFDATVDLTGTVPDSVTVGDTYPVTVGIHMQVTDTNLATAVNALGGSLTADLFDSNVGVSFKDESGKEIGGDDDGLEGDPPQVTLTGDTFTFDGTLSGQRGTADVPGTVTFFLGTFETELTLTGTDGSENSVDLVCDLTDDLPTIGTVKVVAKAVTSNPPPTTPAPVKKPANHPTTPAPSAPATTPPALAKQELANTGVGNAVPLSLAGLALLAFGTGMVVVTRRRRPTQDGPDLI